MKSNILHTLYMLTKYSLRVCIGMLIALNTLLASNGKAQPAISVKEVNISMRSQDQSLEDVFKLIEGQTDYEFTYSSEKIADRTISVIINDRSVAEVLTEISRQAGVRFKQVNNSISVRPLHKLDSQPLIIELEEQGVRISGTVKDENGEGLPGVTILEKGTSNGTSSNAQGAYALTLGNTDAVLVYSFVGYQSKEIAVDNQTTLDVELALDITALEEIVVVGYGTQNKANLTGSVGQVSKEKLERRPVGQTSMALQGLVPGLTVSQTSGQPGRDGGTIRIRGVGSFGGDAKNNPLIIVDGMPTNDLDNIDPNDIESVNVFKDAASAAIYGSRAANGVIVVTTKRGSAAGLRFSYKGNVGWQDPTDLIDKVGGLEHMLLFNEANTNVGRDAPFTDQYIADYRANAPSDDFPEQDWQDLLLSGSGFQQNHYVSMTAGLEKARIFSSLSFLDQEGLVPNSGFQRYSFRLNTDVDLTDRLTASFDVNLRHEKRHNASTNTFFWTNRMPHNVAARNDDGTFATGWDNQNPLAELLQGGADDRNSDIALLNLKLSYDLLPGWNIEGAFSPNYDLTHRKDFNRRVPLYNGGEIVAFYPNVTSLFEQYTRTITTNYRLFSTFERDLAVHHFKVLGGFEFTDFDTEFINASRTNYVLDDFPFLTLGSPDGQQNDGTKTEWSLLSYFGRLNYDFDQKYLFEANVRYDGSSRFSEDNKFGVFPSLSAGWILTEENFLGGQGLVNYLKVRASWGLLGNQNIGSNYPFASTIVLGEDYEFGGSPVQGGALLDLSNPNISWETTEIINFGIDATLWGNLDFTVEYFIKTTDDILLELPIPRTIGLSAPFQNAAKVRNRGLELALDYSAHLGQFDIFVRPNVTFLNNEILDLKDSGPFIYTYTIDQEGEALNSLFGLESIGLFQTQEEVDNHATQFGAVAPGDIRYKDQNEDGVINGDDRVILGNTLPNITYGLELGGAWRGLSLRVLLQGEGDVDGYIDGHGVFAFHVGGTAQEWHRDRWTPENTDASYPRFAFNATNNGQKSSYWMRSASYFRVKNIQLTYNLPQSLLESLPFTGISVYASGENVLTVDDFYDGFDPEAPLGTGNFYPQVKTFSFGVNIDF